MRHADLYSAVDQAFPFDWALPDDPTGWAVADMQRELRCVAVALEATPRTVARASALGADALVVHHPPLYRPLDRLIDGDPTSDALTAAVRANLDLLAAHTNVDCAPGGLNDRLCELLDLTVQGPLLPAPGGAQFKLVTFVPEQQADRVADAAFAAGAGRIGDYAQCSFRAPGTGTFLPLAGAKPYAGRVGRIGREPELRLELIVPQPRLAQCLAALRRAHPYEEPACDVYPLEPLPGLGGLGRWAEPAKPEPFAALVVRIKRVLGLRHLRLVGRPPRRVRRLAVCTGGGRSTLAAAAARPGALYLTGELGYHDERQAEALGLCVLEAGHFGSERIFVELMRAALAARLNGVKIRPLTIEREPASLI